MKYTEGLEASSFHKGENYNAFDYFGAHKQNNSVTFRVWAPHADDVFLVGDFNNWSRETPMKQISSKGIWECSVSQGSFRNGSLYKYLIVNGEKVLYKADPFSKQLQFPPDTATVFSDNSYIYNWTDSHWISNRKKLSKDGIYSKPLNIYELHLGSFMRRNNGSEMSLKELTPLLCAYAKKMSFTHVQLMQIAECRKSDFFKHGAECLYAPYSLWGSPDDLKHMVNELHNCGVGVIFELDLAELGEAEHALSDFDGEALYEASVNKNGAHLFDLTKSEVHSFLISDACYYAEQFHADGLFISHTESMLFLDHKKKKGEWSPNRHGGNISFEAVAFLKKLNRVLKQKFPDVMTLSDDTGNYRHTTRFDNESLGFDIKWVCAHPAAMFNAISEGSADSGNIKDAFEKYVSSADQAQTILPLSYRHYSDGTLIKRLPHEYGDRFAVLRSYMLYLMTLPSKKLSFMSGEFAQFDNWDPFSVIEWYLLGYDTHRDLRNFNAHLNRIYLNCSCLWECDGEPSAFKTVDCSSVSSDILCYRRYDKQGREVLCIINFCPDRTEKLVLKLPDGVYSLMLSTVPGNEQKEYISQNQNSNSSALSLDLEPFQSMILKRQ